MATVAGMALVLAACGGGADEEKTQPSASPTETTTKEEALPTTSSLVGTWSKIGDRVLTRFRPDGTFALDHSNLDAPYAAGTYEVNGRKITFTSKARCVDTWGWKAGITEGEDPLDDELHIVFTDEGCGQEPTGTEWTLARVS